MPVHILIVEDNPIQCELYESFVKEMSLDLQCICCVTLHDAVEECLHTQYPIIIIDMELPDGNGRELCRWIRGLPQGQHSRIVMISGSQSQTDIQDAYQAGIDAYLSKPVDLDQFMKTIRTFLPN
jgi:CheY-like chemotaxis protein